jgi:hypothetical protein
VRIKLRKEVAEQIGFDKLKPFGVTDMGWRFQDRREIDLALLDDKIIDRLAKLLEQHSAGHGVKMALHDIRIWKSGRKDPTQWARNIRQLAPLLKTYLESVPGHRVYKKVEDNWMAYYVNSIAFIEKVVHHGGGVTPAHVIMTVLYESMGGQFSDKVTWWDEDTRRISPIEALARQGFFVETDELRKPYLAEREKFHQIADKIGLQLNVWGKANDRLDGNPSDDDDDNDRYWRHRDPNYYILGLPTDPGRAVIDVFREKPKKEDSENKVRVLIDFWKTKSVMTEEPDDELEDDEPQPSMGDIEIPIHPILAIFDLKRHLRLRLHVNDCEIHTYDANLADKLVLRPELKTLVKLLIAHEEGGFQDIVTGKGGGAVVLLCGPPGVGKTLTAEVYAESEERALYSVQCSQLGTKADDLEAALMQCFARAKRWNAIMLLDEADVYVRRRGDSLGQNAIVGVFLRVLEYQGSVLFMTTNRPEDVDDAVSSRCIAKLVYAYPEPDDQKKIWTILAEGAGLTISRKSIDEIVKRNPKLSGRDVKNLLKLASLMAQGKEIKTEQVEFVKQFKPTE